MNELKPLLIKENLLGYGSSRSVFDLRNGTVAKIPYSNLGILANQLENEYYHKKI